MKRFACIAPFLILLLMPNLAHAQAQGSVPCQVWNETDVAGALGLWRICLQSDAFVIQKSVTDRTNPFGTAITILSATGGNVDIPAWTFTVSSLTGNSFLYSGPGGLLTTPAAPTNGQLLIGSTGVDPVVAGLTGTANQLTVTPGAGSITLSLPSTIAVSAFLNTGTLTLPTSTDTLVGRATIDTLTNKSISGSTNTLTNIANASLTNPSLTVTAGTGMSGGGSVALGSSVTLTNAGVTSLAGTAAQISASGSTGSVTLSLIGPYTPATYTSNGVLYGAGAGSIAATSQGPANSVLTANAGAPSFSASPTINNLTVGNAATNATIQISGANAVRSLTNGTILRFNPLASGQVIQFNNFADTQNNLVLTDTGALGIDGSPNGGTTALDVYGQSVGEIARFRGNTATGGYIALYDTVNSTARGNIGYGSQLFSAGLISDVGIVSNGAVKIGTNGSSTPAFVLDTSGNVTLTGMLYPAVGSASTPTYSFSGNTNFGRYYSAGAIWESTSGTTRWGFGDNALVFNSAYQVGWTSGAANASLDTILLRDGANQLALRNGANAQTFNIYNTFTDSTHYELFQMVWSGNIAILATAKGSGGGSARNILVQPNGANGWLFTTANTLQPNDDNLSVIGSPSGGRIASLNAGTSLNVGTLTNATGSLYVGANTQANLFVDVASSSNGSAANISAIRSGGTQAARADVANGMIGLLLMTKFYSGGSQFASAAIQSVVDGTFTSGQAPPSRWDIYTNAANGSQALAHRIDSLQNNVFNLTGANLAQNATGNFVYIPGVATGAPTGTPTNSYTGAYPMAYDGTDNKNCIYNGSWRCVSYNNSTLAFSNPVIQAYGRSAAQTGAVASVTSFTVGGSDGSFLVSINLNITAYTSGGIVGEVTYTDETGTAQTLTLTQIVTTAGATASMPGITNVTAATTARGLESTGYFDGFQVHIRAKASTAITVLTAAGNLGFSGTYNVEGSITQID